MRKTKCLVDWSGLKILYSMLALQEQTEQQQQLKRLVVGLTLTSKSRLRSSTMIGKIENVTMLSTASFAGKVRSEMLRTKIEGTGVEAQDCRWMR